MSEVIPEEAVEAAAKAIDGSTAEGCGCCSDPKFTAEDDKRADELGISVRALLIAREALEAAAPHMQGAAWESGYTLGYADCANKQESNRPNPHKEEV